MAGAGAGRRAARVRRRLRHDALRGRSGERRLSRAVERDARRRRARHPPRLLRGRVGPRRDQHLRRHPAQAERVRAGRSDRASSTSAAPGWSAPSRPPDGTSPARSVPTSRLPAEYEPLGDTTDEEYFETFREQAEALAEGGVDLFAVETMMFPQEARRGGACVPDDRPARDGHDVLPVRGAPRPRPDDVGESPAEVAKNLLAAGADVVGMNCGRGPDRATVIVREMRAVTDAPLVAYPNAGLPVTTGDQVTYELGPEAMAVRVPGSPRRGRGNRRRLLRLDARAHPSHRRARPRAPPLDRAVRPSCHRS